MLHNSPPTDYSILAIAVDEWGAHWTLERRSSSNGRVECHLMGWQQQHQHRCCWSWLTDWLTCRSLNAKEGALVRWHEVHQPHSLGPHGPNRTSLIHINQENERREKEKDICTENPTGVQVNAWSCNLFYYCYTSAGKSHELRWLVSWRLAPSRVGFALMVRGEPFWQSTEHEWWYVSEDTENIQTGMLC